LVFKNRNGKRYSNDGILKAFKAALKASGVQKPSASPHTLRHSFCSLMLASGESLYQVSMAAGHASTAITAQVYAHVKAGALKGLMERASQNEPTAGPTGLVALPVKA
jgi:integrase/recombinase XerD